jgi:hypothetical protein
VAKLAVLWVEENADDEGVAEVTVRQMAAALGGQHHQQRLSPMAVWRAWQEAKKAGLILVEVGQVSTRECYGSPSKITRVNFKAYQKREEEPVTPPVTGMPSEVLLSSRGRQRTEKKPSDLTVAVEALKSSLEASYQAARGDGLDWPKSAYGDLKAIRKSLHEDDAELMRRWGLFLADKFYPTKNVNRFRVAYPKYAHQHQEPQQQGPLLAIPEFR